MAREEHQPGTHAPETGHYEELNVFGSRSGRVEHVREGERLPLAPRGFTWRHLEDESCQQDRETVEDLTRPPDSMHKGRIAAPAHPHRRLPACALAAASDEAATIGFFTD